MTKETKLAEMIAIGEVEFTRPAGVRMIRFGCHDTYMRKYYGIDTYCPSNENARMFDQVQRPY
jgi:hypothetical protein